MGINEEAEAKRSMASQASQAQQTRGQAAEAKRRSDHDQIERLALQFRTWAKSNHVPFNFRDLFKKGWVIVREKHAGEGGHETVLRVMASGDVLQWNITPEEARRGVVEWVARTGYRWPFD